MFWPPTLYSWSLLQKTGKVKIIYNDHNVITVLPTKCLVDLAHCDVYVRCLWVTLTGKLVVVGVNPLERKSSRQWHNIHFIENVGKESDMNTSPLAKCGVGVHF